MPRLIDITRPLRADLAVWPGDPSFSYDLLGRRTGDAGTNVGRIAMSLHTGTHADAFYHYDNDGRTIDALDPAIFVGPCVVVDVRGRDQIGIAGVVDGLRRLAVDIREHPRLLLKTDFWSDDTRFPTGFPGIDPPLATWLGERGVVLIGLDVPSVDAMGTPGLPAHLAMGAAQITILESLDLRNVAPGTYELIALPLKIAGGDGSPIRALLRET